MATYNAVNYAKKVSVPVQKVSPGQEAGYIFTAYDEYTSLAALTAADVLNLGIRIPKGAKVLRAVIVSPTTGGTVDLGSAGATTKYATAAATSATTQLSPLIDTTVDELLIATVGGTISAAGTYKFMVEYSKY